MTAGEEPTIRLTTGVLLTRLRGSLQIGKAGTPGTSHHRRPRLDEIGLGGFQVLPHADLRVFAFENEVHLTYTPLRLDDLFVSFVLGLRGVWFQRRDGQVFPNDPNVRAGLFSGDPLSEVTLGVRMSF